MSLLKHIPALLLFVVGAILLNYYLPDRDVVRVVSTEIKRQDIGKKAPFWDRGDIGNEEGVNQDVRFIYTVKKNGKTAVYRNQDTGFGFPFYFKFDSSDLAAKAEDLSKSEEQWVAIRHYGWRIRMFSVFPNATSLKTVSGPDVRLIPWFNIVFIALLLFLWIFIWRKIRAWKAKRIDPTLDKVGDSIGDAAREVGETVGEGSEKARGFWKKLFGSAKKK